MSNQSKEMLELDMLVAELDYENRLLRARNTRLQQIIDGIVPRLEQACGADAMPPVLIRKYIEERS